jgi:hypothetical protein
MTALIIGGDDIEGIKKEIALHGVDRSKHWDGRKPRDVRKSIPRDTTLVVIMFDCVNHNLVHKVKQDARRSGIPIVFAARSAGDTRKRLEAFRAGGARTPSAISGEGVCQAGAP